MKRRDFVKIGSVAASGAALGVPNILTGGSLPGEKIRMGIIGTGDRGLGMMTDIGRIPNMEVAACSDIIPFRLEKALQKTDNRAKGYNDYRKLLEDKNVDAVLVSTPFSMHAKMAIEALDAGKHVYCEKTMAKGADDIRKVVEAAGKSKKVFQTGHQYHNSRLYRHVADMVTNGEIGPITSFQCQWNRNGDWRRPVPDPKWERMINWRMYKEYSGGLVAELCSHQIDFINWITDSHPQKVMGIGGIDYWKDGRETFDNIHVLMEYKNGLKGKLTCLTTNGYDDYKVKLFGKKGTIVMDYKSAWLYPEESTEKIQYGQVDGVSGATIKKSGYRAYTKIDVEHKDPSTQALIDFRTNILEEKEPVSNVKTGALAAYSVYMANKAMENNTQEEWNDNLYKTA